MTQAQAAYYRAQTYTLRRLLARAREDRDDALASAKFWAALAQEAKQARKVEVVTLKFDHSRS
jgi:hypothetical protein